MRLMRLPIQKLQRRHEGGEQGQQVAAWSRAVWKVVSARAGAAGQPCAILRSEGMAVVGGKVPSVRRGQAFRGRSLRAHAPCTSKPGGMRRALRAGGTRVSR